MKRTLYSVMCVLLLLVGCMNKERCMSEEARSVQDTQLLQAAITGDLSSVKTALSQGANVNARDKDELTALIWAAGNGNIEIVKLLLEKGACVNAKASSIGVLWAAVYEGHTEVLKLLIEKGANVNAKVTFNNAEWTVLKLAKEMKYTDAIQLLEKAGAKE